MNSRSEWPEYEFDARTFQTQLASLANTVALKVEREGKSIIPKPNFVVIDIYVMLRQSLSIYNLFFFINTDKRRHSDPDYRLEYSAAVLPLIRCMFDCLYNITLILLSPETRGCQFRESGYKQALKAFRVTIPTGGEDNMEMLAGLELEEQKLNGKLSAVRAMIAAYGDSGRIVKSARGKGKRKPMSAATKRKLSVLAHRRWSTKKKEAKAA